MLLKQPQASLFRNFGWIKDGAHKKKKNKWEYLASLTAKLYPHRWYLLYSVFIELSFFKRVEKGFLCLIEVMWLYFPSARVNKKTWLKTCRHHHCRHLRIPASVLVSECSALKMRIAAVEEKVQILTQTKMKPHCEMLTQWGHYLQLESALFWPEAWSQDKIILNWKTNVWENLSDYFFEFVLWPREGLDGATLALRLPEGPKQEKLSFERTTFRAQLNIFTTWYKYFMPYFAKHCFQKNCIVFGSLVYDRFDHIFIDGNAAVALPGVEFIWMLSSGYFKFGSV